MQPVRSRRMGDRNKGMRNPRMARSGRSSDGAGSVGVASEGMLNMMKRLWARWLMMVSLVRRKRMRRSCEECRARIRLGSPYPRHIRRLCRGVEYSGKQEENKRTVKKKFLKSKTKSIRQRCAFDTCVPVWSLLELKAVAAAPVVVALFPHSELPYSRPSLAVVVECWETSSSTFCRRYYSSWVQRPSLCSAAHIVDRYYPNICSAGVNQK